MFAFAAYAEAEAFAAGCPCHQLQKLDLARELVPGEGTYEAADADIVAGFG